MAPPKFAKKDTVDKRVVHVLDCGKKALGLLKERLPLTTDLTRELDTAVKRCFPIPSASVTAHLTNLKILGSEIWNASTNLLRDDINELDISKSKASHSHQVACLRAFSFFLLDASQTASSRTKESDQQAWIFKLAIKAARVCIDKSEQELALKVLERCADFVSAAEEESPIVRIAEEMTATGPREPKMLVFEYYLLRMAHAWKGDRYDMANHFFVKLDLTLLKESADLAEKSAELFHAIGKSLAARDTMDLASNWCDRALNALDACDIEDMTPESSELRLTITVTFVKSLLSTKEEDSRQHAAALLKRLYENGMGHRTAVSMMHFTIIMADSPVDEKALHDTMIHMIRSSVLTDRTFQAIIQTIDKAKAISIRISLSVLHELIIKRLLPDIGPNHDIPDVTLTRLQKSTIGFVLYAASKSNPSPSTTVVELQDLFDTIYQKFGRSMSSQTTHTLQALVWKTAGASDADTAKSWLQLLRHPLFSNTGNVNSAKIERKRIMNALAQEDVESAREAFFSLPASAQNESTSRYLAFKIALLSRDLNLAMESLSIITKNSNKDSKYLYACVLEAQDSGMRPMAVMALQAIIDKNPPEVHFSTLLRCTVQLLLHEIQSPNKEHTFPAEDVVRIFETAAANIRSIKQGPISDWSVEIQWWSKNSYNLALQLCAEIHPSLLVRLLTVCTTFLEPYPINERDMQNDIINRQVLCYFLAASALIVLGRSSDNEDNSAETAYSEAQKHITSCTKAIQKLNSPDDHRLQARHFELLKYSLESTLKLCQWDHITPIIQSLLNFPQTDRWESLIDLALIIHDEITTKNPSLQTLACVNTLLERCINETWKKDKDIVKMARWLRLTFQIHLADKPGGDLAIKIVQQAAAIARRGVQGKNEVYPETELQWMAATAFNRAVDFIVEGDEGGGRGWIEAALELARYAGDGGALHAHLTLKTREAEERRGRGVV